MKAKEGKIPMNHLWHREESQTASNRSFGLVFAAVFLILSLIPFIKHSPFKIQHYTTLVISLLFLILAITDSNLLTIPKIWWLKLGEVLHHVVSPIVMGVLFFGVITPVALFIKILRIDLIDMKLNKRAKSYWKEKSPQGPPPETMSNQF